MNRTSFFLKRTLLLILALPLFAAGQTFTVLHKFELSDGQVPESRLAQDPAGNLYGTTGAGGTLQQSGDGRGTIYRIDTSGRHTVIHTFTGGADGWEPLAGLMPGAQGHAYGTAFFGGDLSCGEGAGCGTLYQLDQAGKLTILYSFQGPWNGIIDGQSPNGDLLRDPAGNIFGTTFYGGDTFSCSINSDGCGTVYEYDATGKESVLYSFLGSNANADGAAPTAGLVRDAAGNLYGSTAWGGMLTDQCSELVGCGTIFKLSPDGQGGWTETVIYRFNGLDGGQPIGRLLIDTQGALYGATYYGGNQACVFGCGTVFKLALVSGQWQHSVLYAFSGDADGRNPGAGLVRDSRGNFYGTTVNGGYMQCQYGNGNPGCGVVFRVDPQGEETVLHTFSGTDGFNPKGEVLLNERQRALYGTTTYGGDIANCSLPHYYDGCGVVFRIQP